MFSLDVGYDVISQLSNNNHNELEEEGIVIWINTKWSQV
jgi:hypothetical protein